MLIVLSSLDIASTSVGLLLPGSGIFEQNSLGATAWQLAGPLGLVLDKSFWCLPWLLALYLEGRDPEDRAMHRLLTLTLFGVGLFYLWLVAQNILILGRLV